MRQNTVAPIVAQPNTGYAIMTDMDKLHQLLDLADDLTTDDNEDMRADAAMVLSDNNNELFCDMLVSKLDALADRVRKTRDDIETRHGPQS